MPKPKSKSRLWRALRQRRTPVEDLVGGGLAVAAAAWAHHTLQHEEMQAWGAAWAGLLLAGTTHDGWHVTLDDDDEFLVRLTCLALFLLMPLRHLIVTGDASSLWWLTLPVAFWLCFWSGVLAVRGTAWLGTPRAPRPRAPTPRAPTRWTDAFAEVTPARVRRPASTPRPKPKR